MNTINEIQWEHVLTDDEKVRINPLRKIRKLFLWASILTGMALYNTILGAEPLKKMIDAIAMPQILLLIIAALGFLVGTIRLIKYFLLPSYLKKIPDKIVSQVQLENDGFIYKIENEVLPKCFYSQINKIQLNSAYVTLDLQNAPTRVLAFSKSDQASVSREAFLEILKQKMDTAPQVEINPKKKLSLMQKVSLSIAFLTVCIFIFVAAIITSSKDEKLSWSQKISIYIMETEAKYGSAVDKYNVGYYYDSGTMLPQNYAKAAAWYRKAADLGYSNAQCNLALLYYKGLGVEQNDQKAFAWSMKSARQGNVYGELQLASAYSEGKGTKPNLIKAYAWLNLALLNKEIPLDMYSDGLKLQISFQKMMTDQEIAEAEALSKTLVTHQKLRSNI